MPMRFILHREEGKMGCGTILGLLILAAIVITAFNSYEESKQKAIQKSEQQKKLERDKSAFLTNRENILKELRFLLENKQYTSVTSKAKQYLHTNDKELKQIYNKAKEMKLLATVKTIPATQLQQNQKIYKKLKQLNPDKPLYKEKYDYYTRKIEAQRKKEARREAKFGKPPIQSAWDGSYYEVERYLKKVMNDPDSLKMDGCTKVYYTEKGWLVGCDYRGRNAFGGMIRQSNWFTIVHGQVVKMHDADAYSP